MDKTAVSQLSCVQMHWIQCPPEILAPQMKMSKKLYTKRVTHSMNAILTSKIHAFIEHFFSEFLKKFLYKILASIYISYVWSTLSAVSFCNVRDSCRESWSSIQNILICFIVSGSCKCLFRTLVFRRDQTLNQTLTEVMILFIVLLKTLFAADWTSWQRKSGVTLKYHETSWCHQFPPENLWTTSNKTEPRYQWATNILTVYVLWNLLLAMDDKGECYTSTASHLYHKAWSESMTMRLDHFAVDFHVSKISQQSN